MNIRAHYLTLRWTALLMLLVTCSFAAATKDKAQDYFLKGNNAYEAKDFTSAIVWYDSAVATGFTSSALEFNLANAWYKSNRIAPAILHYERAARLSPSDEDITFNLRIAQLKTVDKIDAMPEIFYRRWARNTTLLFSDRTLCGLLIGCSFLFFLSLTAYFFSSRLRLRKAGLAGGFVLLAVTFVLWITATYKDSSETGVSAAIVMEASSYVKSSPDEKGNDLFILHEGTKVEILDALNDWKKIRIANGTVGWISATSIEAI